MPLLPFTRMWERVEIARQDSGTSLFLHLLYAGEMLAKTLVAGFVAAIADDPDRHRYRQLQRLVRADSIGEWGTTLDEVLIGPASQHLIDEARTDQKEYTQRLGPGAWQHEAVILIDKCLRALDRNREGMPFKVEARRWVSSFAELRNRTRGHGATPPHVCDTLCTDLEHGLRLIAENSSIFKRQWAFLYRNLSGKYRVTKLSDAGTSFDPLKTSRERSKWGNFADGICIFLDQPYSVELVRSDPDATDFFYPNGGFNGKRFELISYLTDTITFTDAAPYLRPASDLPASETQGTITLNGKGEVFSNLPPLPRGYINRQALESELRDRLLDDRHPVITLVGRGGIGKTSLALSVLHSITDLNRFGAIFWFSARDIDLLPEGPKLVRPHLLTRNDVAKEFVRLMEPREAASPQFKDLQYFSDALTKSSLGVPLLLVFDNFETVKTPTELFAWLDTYIRLPNKILITTRSREFKGDYPVEVLGMTETESERLMETTAAEHGILQLLTDTYRRELFRESDGHPYVIKVLLGEVSKAKKLVKIERIVAGKDEILDALFERTYAGLSPSAKQVFLTLCSWRSTIPQLALEAVMLRPANERMDLDEAVEELRRSSFIEITDSSSDSEIFISVPLVASVFGRRKLSVSTIKTAVQANTELLLYFGAAQKADVRHGIGYRVERFFRNVAEHVSRGQGQLTDYLPMLEFLSQRHAPGWLLLARLHEEAGEPEGLLKAKWAVERFLERSSNNEETRQAWERLSQLCRRSEDWVGEVHALVEMCSLSGTPFESISAAMNRWNSMFRQQYIQIAGDERQLLARRLLQLFESHFGEADATDLSRAAWIHLALHEDTKARDYVKRGLAIDPDNEYCRNLADRLGLQMGMRASSDA